MEKDEEALQVVGAAWAKLQARLLQEEYKWWKWLSPLVDAMVQHPRLNRLYPFTSHDTLCLSRNTKYPFSSDCPHVYAVADNNFRVFGPRYRTVASRIGGSIYLVAEHEVIGNGEVTEALEYLDAVLPAHCGTAIVGNEEDLRRSEGRPILDALTKKLFAATRDPHALASLLEHGSAVNATDYRGRTPLMFAVLDQTTESVRVLLQNGADVHKREEGGMNALSLALIWEETHPEIVTLLKEHGAME